MKDFEKGTDPVEAADDERELYGISSWERRSVLDGASVAIYWLAVRAGQVLLVSIALLIFLAVGGFGILREPVIGVLAVRSALPAVALAGYVWYSDVTTSEPLSLLAATFIHSSFAGYYLGLVKFNPENRGPIVVTGLIIAAVIHATYNTTVGIGSGLIRTVTGLPHLTAFFVYVLLSVGGFGYLLYRKIQQYKNANQAARSNETPESEAPVIDAETE